MTFKKESSTGANSYDSYYIDAKVGKLSKKDEKVIESLVDRLNNLRRIVASYRNGVFKIFYDTPKKGARISGSRTE